MADEREIAELVKYAELLTLSPADAIAIISTAIREVEQLQPPPDTARRRAMLFRCVTQSALQRRHATAWRH